MPHGCFLDLSWWNYFQNNHLHGTTVLVMKLFCVVLLCSHFLSLDSFQVSRRVQDHTFLCDSSELVTPSGPWFTPSLKRESGNVIPDAQASAEVWSVLFLHERAWVSVWLFVLCHCFFLFFQEAGQDLSWGLKTKPSQRPIFLTQHS